MEKHAETTRAKEQLQSASNLTISRCPKCNDQFTYIEEVLIHKCWTKTGDLRGEFQVFLELREALSEELKLRTLKHNAKFSQIYGKGTTVLYENQEWWEDDGTIQGCLRSANQQNNKPNKEPQRELHARENEANTKGGQLSKCELEETPELGTKDLEEVGMSLMQIAQLRNIAAGTIEKESKQEPYKAEVTTNAPTK